MGAKLHTLIASPEDQEKAVQGLEQFKNDGTGELLGFSAELTGVRKDGRTFPAEAAVAPFRLNNRWYAVGTVRDITNRKRMQAELEEMASTDPLTGAFNRRRFTELVGRELARDDRYGGAMALLMMDLDHFKAVNDTHGHNVGDMVLQELVVCCKRVLRETDVLGRWGGEEFVAALLETDQERAFKTADRLRREIAAISLAAGRRQIKVTISIGLALADTPGLSLNHLVERADKALYQAKDGGRDRVVVWDKSM